MARMNARRDGGKCADCGTAIHAGDPIDYERSRAGRQLLCDACAPAPLPAAPTVVRVTREGDQAAFRVTGRRLSDAVFTVYRSALSGARFAAGVNHLPLARAGAAIAALAAAHLTLDVAPAVRTAIDELALEQVAAAQVTEQQIEAVNEILRARGGSLYFYQREGVLWLGPRFAGLLADDMGLGKTLQVLTALPVNAPVVVVCPAVAKSVWKSEAARWRPDLAVTVLSGRGSFRAPAPNEVVILNYDILPPTPAERTEEKRVEDAARTLPALDFQLWYIAWKTEAKPVHGFAVRETTTLGGSNVGTGWALYAGDPQHAPLRTKGNTWEVHVAVMGTPLRALAQEASETRTETLEAAKITSAAHALSSPQFAVWYVERRTEREPFNRLTLRPSARGWAIFGGDPTKPPKAEGDAATIYGAMLSGGLRRLARDADEARQRVLNQTLQPGTVLVLDEAHACASRKATRTKRSKALAQAARENGGRAWALTATPLKNTPPELWNVLDTVGLAYEAFGSWETFFELFNGTKDRWGQTTWGEPSPEVAELLQRVSLRRRKTDVLTDLPEKTHRTITAEIDRETARLCDEAYPEIENALSGLGIEEAVETLEKNPLTFKKLSEARAALSKAKIPAMLEVVESYEAQGEPLVVFSAYRAPIDLLAKREGWASITGDTSNDKRGEIVAAFQTGKLKGVACTIRAGGVAITLTHASNVLRVDREWNPALNVQAEDRCYRIGQKNAVLVTDLVADHPLDERIAEVLSRKEALFGASVDAAAVMHVAPTVEPTIDWAALEADAAAAVREMAAAEEAARAAANEHEKKRAEHRANGARRKARKYVREAAARRLREEEAEEDAPRRGPHTTVERWAIEGLRQLAADDPDRARKKNEVGFNASDGGIGHALAWLGELTDQEWRLALRIARHYPGQVGGPPSDRPLASEDAEPPAVPSAAPEPGAVERAVLAATRGGPRTPLQIAKTSGYTDERVGPVAQKLYEDGVLRVDVRDDRASGFTNWFYFWPKVGEGRERTQQMLDALASSARPPAAPPARARPAAPAVPSIGPARAHHPPSARPAPAAPSPATEPEERAVDPVAPAVQVAPGERMLHASDRYLTYRLTPSARTEALSNAPRTLEEQLVHGWLGVIRAERGIKPEAEPHEREKVGAEIAYAVDRLGKAENLALGLALGMERRRDALAEVDAMRKAIELVRAGAPTSPTVPSRASAPPHGAAPTTSARPVPTNDGGTKGGAWSSSRAPVTCQFCGEQWDRDPSLEVSCPQCKVRIGAWCKSPSGHKAMRLHVAREHAAIAAGKLHICPKAGAPLPGASAAPDPAQAAAPSSPAPSPAVAPRYRSPLGNTPSGNAHARIVDTLREIAKSPEHPYNRTQFTRVRETLAKYTKSLSRAFTRDRWAEVVELLDTLSAIPADRRLYRRLVELLTHDVGGDRAAGERWEEDVARAHAKTARALPAAARAGGAAVAAPPPGRTREAPSQFALAAAALSAPTGPVGSPFALAAAALSGPPPSPFAAAAAAFTGSHGDGR